MALHDRVLRILLHEGDGARPLTPGERFSAIQGLLEQGYPVSRSTTPTLPTPPTDAPFVVAGAFNPDDANPGRPLLHLTGPETRTTATETEARREAVGAPKPGAWLPWFPVIDYDRCTNCMQCLSFCLFDVYGVNEGKIQVQNNNKCKTDCPACSRVCPEVAILFPKYRHGPINGDVVSADDVRRESMKVDISSLLGGDIYAALRDRNAKFKSRFSKERDSDKALEERQKCLVKLGEKLDIPPEVFASLPSPEEIQMKAAEASAKAQAALAANKQ